jgi:phosphoglycolate phosphatase
LLIVFDLDGTLIDSAKDLAISMNATRTHLGMAPLDPNLIYSFVGNGAAVLVKRALGPDASEELNRQALEFFLQYYRAHALEHTHLYPGVREMLTSLAEKGHTQAILTNKPVKISRDIVTALDLARYFSQTYGGDSFAAKKPDPIGLNTLMREIRMEPAETLMVGDSGVDIQTARNAGVTACGVSWGFQPGAFQTDAPDLLIDKPADLIQFVTARC